MLVKHTSRSDQKFDNELVDAVEEAIDDSGHPTADMRATEIMRALAALDALPVPVILQ
jgi:hypothetical protein